MLQDRMVVLVFTGTLHIVFNKLMSFFIRLSR